MDWSLFSARVFKSSQVVKWVEKGERAPRRKNLGRDGYSGTGVRRSPQNGVLGALENRGARPRLLSHTPTPGCGTGAVQFSPKGTLHVDGNNPEHQQRLWRQWPWGRASRQAGVTPGAARRSRSLREGEGYAQRLRETAAKSFDFNAGVKCNPLTRKSRRLFADIHLSR